FSTANWKTNGGSTVWQDGNLVRFDDTASSGAPDGTNITVTLNTTVSPLDMSFNNLSNAFTIVGTGNLNTGSGGNLELLGGGTVTLTTTNTFAGGTIVSGGSQLNLNSGGNGSGGPVGTGALTLNANARLGNSSGAAVALQYPVQKEWNGSFSYVGNNDLDLGSGSVDLNETITVTVATNNLIVDGSINDNGQAKQLTKAGNGTLTLAGNNSWNGLKLQAGQINMNNPGAAGSGFVTFLGGAMDNTSGADVTLSASAYHMSSLAGGGVFTFVGTTNLDFGSATIDANNSATIVFNVLSNTWRTAAIQSGNTILVKTGNGAWALGGADVVNNAVVTVNQGEFDLARDGGNPAIGTGAAGDIAGSGHGLVVNSNAVAKLTGSLGNQISHGAGGNSYIEVILNTGVLDLNAQSQGVDMISMTNGVLRNSASGSYSIVTVAGTGGTHPTNAITLTGTNCQFDITTADSTLELNALVNGGGTLVKTGLGFLTLDQSNSYTGNITISGGTLNLNFPDIATTAVVTIASNSVLNINFPNADTNTVAGLVLNGTNAAAGLHNNSTDPTFITGNGNVLVVPPPTINPLPGPIQFLVSGGGSVLNLAWPTNAGWLLLVQTNQLGKGLSTNWVTVPGSDSITNLSVPMSPGNGATFYRLLRPY
ncbi:MAG: autotransporter-associated beta strand repeat-containing protein, partial [Verrucomicrobia bacterium]|nr:autotransporter-associated beta strand repeat-containing protein [Verrucomicrobiota bacterium]